MVRPIIERVRKLWRPGSPKRALALAGEGIIGGMYEVGLLAAPGFRANSFDIYVGVSAGSVVASLMANGVRPGDLYRIPDQGLADTMNFEQSSVFDRHSFRRDAMKARNPKTSYTRVPRSGRHRRRWIAGVALWATIMGLVLAGWHVPSGRAEQPKHPREAAVSVAIKNFDFVPPTITLSAGGIVRWVNADVANHQISSGVVDGNRPKPDGRISSPLLFRGDEFTATVRIPGEYPYYCGVHPFMRGNIVVK